MQNLQKLIGSIFNEDSLDFMDSLPNSSIDLIISDGPYGVTEHGWDKVKDIQHYNLTLLQKFSRLLKPGGAVYLFGKPDCIDFIDYRPYLNLQSKIVWYQPSRLSQGRRSYTNNYDVICYFTKGNAKTFNLDDIRVPQLVELEHRKRCESVPSVKNGPYSKTAFNDMGKNPGNVWGDIKQLTYKSKELISREMLNTIQKPQKLIERLVKASSNPGDVVFDPFVGSGTTGVVCQELNRLFLGCEIDMEYCRLARQRLTKLHKDEIHSKSLPTFSEVESDDVASVTQLPLW